MRPILQALAAAAAAAAAVAMGGGGCGASSGGTAPPVQPPPTTPAPPTTPSPAEVIVPVGASIQALVDAHPPGTTFRIRAGRHRRQSVLPKRGNTFVGEPGAALDGEHATEYAFYAGVAPHPADVTIRGLVIERYKPILQSGAIEAGGHTAAELSSGWVVEDCEIRENAAAGIRMAHRMRIRRNHIHHNGQIGIVGLGDDVVVEENELAYNNTARVDFGWEAGGAKFLNTNRLVVRGNFSHHNHGPGLWTDNLNHDALYESNRVEDNAGAGIFHEISYRAVIRNNVVARNGFGFAEWLYGAGILISSSPDVEVYGNTVTANANGIAAVMQRRGVGDRGPLVVQNLHVHDNTIAMTVGRTGLAQDIGDLSYFTQRNNRFERNTYRLGAAAAYFAWMDRSLTEAEWRGFGLDVGGVFVR